jgi:predicted extracellular nuclease
MDLQLVPSFGSGDASAYEGDTVTVTGIVTASYQSGGLGYLYIQDPSSTEFAGIYVDGGPISIFSLNRGDEVRVTGIVEENFGFTQIAADSVVATSNTGTILPVVLDPSNASLFPFSSELEKYESMFLRYENPTATGLVWVADPDLGFAEYSIGSGQNASVAARILAGRAVTGQAQGSLNVSYLSDTATYGSNLNAGITPIEVNSSTSMDYVEGILFYAFGNYKLTPRNNADFANIVVSIEDIASSEVKTKLYPNPAQDRVMIQLDENYDFNQLNVEVIDLNGRVVVEHRTATHLSSINLSGLERGMYIVKVMNKGEMIHTAKMILK